MIKSILIKAELVDARPADHAARHLLICGVAPGELLTRLVAGGQAGDGADRCHVVLKLAGAACRQR